MGPGLLDTSCTFSKDLSVVFYLIPRASNTLCQRFGMFPVHELVGQDRGKGVQVSPSNFPFASTLTLFWIFAYLCSLPLWLHTGPCYLCVYLQQLGLYPHQKVKKDNKPKAAPPKPWTKGKAHPLLRWRGSCFITMALTIRSGEWEGVWQRWLWIDWLGSRFCKWEGSSCPLWHAGRSISGELADFFPSELLHAVPRCRPALPLPRLGRGKGPVPMGNAGRGKPGCLCRTYTLLGTNQSSLLL